MNARTFTGTPSGTVATFGGDTRAPPREDGRGFTSYDADALRSLFCDLPSEVGLASNFGSMIARCAARPKQASTKLRECDRCDAIGWLDVDTGKGARSPCPESRLRQCLRCRGIGTVTVEWTDLMKVHGGPEGKDATPKAEAWALGAVWDARLRAGAISVAYRTLASMVAGGLAAHVVALARLYGGRPPGLGYAGDPRSAIALLGERVTCPGCKSGAQCERCGGRGQGHDVGPTLYLVDLLRAARALGDETTEELHAERAHGFALLAGCASNETTSAYALEWRRAVTPVEVGAREAVLQALRGHMPTRKDDESDSDWLRREERGRRSRDALVSALRAEAGAMKRAAETAYAEARVAPWKRRRAPDARKVPVLDGDE